MCIRREKARRSLSFPPVSKPRTHITYMLRQCTSIIYIYIYKYEQNSLIGLLFGIRYEDNYNIIVYKYTIKTGTTEIEKEV